LQMKMNQWSSLAVILLVAVCFKGSLGAAAVDRSSLSPARLSIIIHEAEQLRDAVPTEFDLDAIAAFKGKAGPLLRRMNDAVRDKEHEVAALEKRVNDILRRGKAGYAAQSDDLIKWYAEARKFDVALSGRVLAPKILPRPVEESKDKVEKEGDAPGDQVLPAVSDQMPSSEEKEEVIPPAEPLLDTSQSSESLSASPQEPQSQKMLQIEDKPEVVKAAEAAPMAVSSLHPVVPSKAKAATLTSRTSHRRLTPIVPSRPRYVSPKTRQPVVKQQEPPVKGRRALIVRRYGIITIQMIRV